eukprot:1757127-Amphidinium_carterae.1
MQAGSDAQWSWQALLNTRGSAARDSKAKNVLYDVSPNCQRNFVSHVQEQAIIATTRLSIPGLGYTEQSPDNSESVRGTTNLGRCCPRSVLTVATLLGRMTAEKVGQKLHNCLSQRAPVQYVSTGFNIA